MAQETSKSQIDRLGERLKKDKSDEAGLRLLEEYRQTFGTAYEFVRKCIREQLSLETTGRKKTTQSIVDKLRRESIRLTQIQDIAGCRLIAADIADQDQVVESLSKIFGTVAIVDRREKPSHGYRAVHVIVQTQEKLVEIQIRTALQHLWAELSEKYSDVVDQAIKYGGGNDSIQEYLIDISSRISENEFLERGIASLQKELINLQSLESKSQELMSQCQSIFDELRLGGLPAQYPKKYIEQLAELKEAQNARIKESSLCSAELSSLKEKHIFITQELFKLLSDKINVVGNSKEQS